MDVANWPRWAALFDAPAILRCDSADRRRRHGPTHDDPVSWQEWPLDKLIEEPAEGKADGEDPARLATGPERDACCN